MKDDILNKVAQAYADSQHFDDDWGSQKDKQECVKDFKVGAEWMKERIREEIHRRWTEYHSRGGSPFSEYAGEDMEIIVFIDSMHKVEEPSDRADYRMECKHYGHGSRQCYKRSGYIGSAHYFIACDGKCARMKRWDKTNGYDNVDFKID